jgi:hypothetical protein
MPTGKADIISRKAWRTTLSELVWNESLLIAIESGQKYEDCSVQERSERIASARRFIASSPRLRVSYAINIRSLKPFKKSNAIAFTRNELRALRSELREAVKFYQLARAAPLATPTGRRKQLTVIKRAAARLLEKPEQAHGRLDPETTKILDSLAQGDRPGTGRYRARIPGRAAARSRSCPVDMSGAMRLTQASPPLRATSPVRLGMAHVSLGYVLAAIVLTSSRMSQRGAMLAVPPLDDCVVAVSPLPAPRCDDEAQRTEGSALRDLHPQIDRA